MNCLLYKLEFWCDCNLDPYVFENDWKGLIYLEGYIAQTEEDRFEEGEEDGEGVFNPDYQRSRKVYIFRTMLVPQSTIETLYLLPLMDHVELTLLTGEVLELNNIEITHTYQFDNKREATAEIRYDLDEVIVKGSCCL